MSAAMRSSDRDDIKATLSDPHHVCSQLGILEGSKRQAKGLSVCCPAHAEKTASCSVTLEAGTIRVKCFACDLSGDVFNLIAAVHRLDLARDFPRVLEIAAELAGIDISKPPTNGRPELRAVPKAPAESPITDLSPEWNALPPVDEDTWEYLRGRGLGDAVEECRTPSPVGEDNLSRFSSRGYKLAMPLRDGAGRVVAIQVRRIAPSPTGSEKDDRFLVVGQSGSGVFGSVSSLSSARIVILCEGMTDTLAARIAFAGAPAVAVIGIAGVKATAGLLTLPVKGKRVVIATDADAKGDEAATIIGAELARRGATVTRARPEGVKDVAEMFRSGVDLRSFVRRCMTGFESVASSVQRERAERQAMQGRSLSFGVHFLDLALGGIFPDDLILLGAKTNRGKTELATGIARQNALAGKAVHYFALEAGRREIDRRIKYPLIAGMVWEDRNTNGDLWKRLNFLDWFKGDLDSVLDKYERRADAEMARKYPSLFVRYKGVEAFDKETLARLFSDVASETDLIIVDHLHYIDTEGQNENRDVKLIVQRLRDLQAKLGKPVMFIVHVRKAERGRKAAALVPEIEDIHGTSDAGKIATKAIMIAPAFDQPAPAPGLAPTYIEPAKCRADGSRTRFVGLVPYNFRTGLYEPSFVLGKLSDDRSKMLFVADKDLPAWATARPVMP